MNLLNYGGALKMKHQLKIIPEYFKEIVDGNKNFEVRKMIEIIKSVIRLF